MRKTIRFYLALWAAKATTAILRMMHRNATHFPGLIAMKLCPDFLGRVDKPNTIICVTGTNGKTTVCNLLNDLLEANGQTPLNNRLGGNVRGGIVSTFLNASTMTGHISEEIAVLEIDERSAIHIFKYIKPNYLVITNLFRDSLKRNAHSEFISDILNQAIPRETKLIVNADDLISSHLAQGNDRVAFGIAHREDDWETPQNIVCDIVMCPRCGAALKYDFVRYNHIGRAHCPSCDYGSLTPSYEITAVNSDTRTLTVQTPAGEERYHMIGDNITDWYNTLAAVAMLRELGLSAEQIEASLKTQKIVKSRFDQFEKNGHTVTMNLCKGQNPIACSRAFDFVRRTDGTKAVILLIEDYFDAKNSSENIAWLYDADFEFLNDDSIKQVIVAGVRATDFRLRLLLAGVADERIICLQEAPETADAVDLSAVNHTFILHDVIQAAYPTVVRDRLLERLEKAEEVEA